MESRDVIGRWPGILMSLGINIGEAGKHTACPICGPGRNKHRFRFTDIDGRGTWICNQCGNGDGWILVQKVFKTDFKGALEIVKRLDVTPAISEPQPEPKASRVYLRELYSGSDPISLLPIVTGKHRQ